MKPITLILSIFLFIAFSTPVYAGLIKSVGKGAATFVIVKAVKNYGKKKGVEATKKISAYIIKKIKHQDIQAVGRVFNSVRKTAYKYASKHPDKPYLKNNADRMLANLSRSLAQRGRIIPNWTYKSIHGYRYKTDSLGRLKGVSGKLRLKKGKRNGQQTIVGKEGKAGDEGGHLIATIFDGIGTRLNVTPMSFQLNHGKFLKMERSWRAALRSGKDVRIMKMEFKYPEQSSRFNRLIVDYKIDKKEFNNNVFSQ